MGVTGRSARSSATAPQTESARCTGKLITPLTRRPFVGPVHRAQHRRSRAMEGAGELGASGVTCTITLTSDGSWNPLTEPVSLKAATGIAGSVHHRGEGRRPRHTSREPAPHRPSAGRSGNNTTDLGVSRRGSRAPGKLAIRRASDAVPRAYTTGAPRQGCERAAALWTAWGAPSGVRDDSAQRRRALGESQPLLQPCPFLSSAATHETVAEAARPGNFAAVSPSAQRSTWECSRSTTDLRELEAAGYADNARQ